MSQQQSQPSAPPPGMFAGMSTRAEKSSSRKYFCKGRRRSRTFYAQALAATRKNATLYGERASGATVGRYISSDPIGIDGGLNTFGYVAQNPVNFIDPWGLRDYTWKETQQIFLDPAFKDATSGWLSGALNIFQHSSALGDYDFAWNEHKNDTFCIKGQKLDAGQFGNFLAGYQGQAYDENEWLSPIPGLASVAVAGFLYHYTGHSYASGIDPYDRLGAPYIFAGAAATPDSGIKWLTGVDAQLPSGGSTCGCQ